MVRPQWFDAQRPGHVALRSGRRAARCRRAREKGTTESNAQHTCTPFHQPSPSPHPSNRSVFPSPHLSRPKPRGQSPGWARKRAFLAPQSHGARSRNWTFYRPLKQREAGQKDRLPLLPPSTARPEQIDRTHGLPPPRPDSCSKPRRAQERNGWASAGLKGFRAARRGTCWVGR